MKAYKVAVIGCGRIAGHNCRAVVGTEGLELAAVCDLEIEKANLYRDEFDVPAFSNYHTMLTEVTDIDIVAIITPSGMHFEHSLDVLKKYNKHIIVEKPTFMKPSHLNEAYSVAEKLGLKIFPIFQLLLCRCSFLPLPVSVFASDYSLYEITELMWRPLRSRDLDHVAPWSRDRMSEAAKLELGLL